MSNKGSTSIVGYIAILMIAGAALWHGEAPISASGLQTNAVAFHEVDSTYFMPQESRKVRIQVDGKIYDAVLVESDVETDKLKLTY